VRLGLATSKTSPEPAGWRQFRGHRIVRQLLRGYHLGSDATSSRHWLVVDQPTGRTTVSLPKVAHVLLTGGQCLRRRLQGEYVSASGGFRQSRTGQPLLVSKNA
jgi:hypothetical protein